MKNRHIPLILLLALTFAFVLGVLQLFKLRFETGDVYPPYSTLRADPLGASAIYESLDEVPGISVSRDFRPTDEMPEGKGTAYLHLACSRNDWDELDEDSFKEIETFVKAGGRLVIAFFPETIKPHQSHFARKSKEDAKKPDEQNTGQEKSKAKSGTRVKRRKKAGDKNDQMFHLVSLAKRWGIGFDVKSMKTGAEGTYEPLTVANRNEPSLPELMTWHSGVVMTNLDEAWRVIYARDRDAVLAERHFGSGTVVFSTDSYFLSNEAMQKDRHAELLAWVVGPCRQVMFDEAHLGIVNNPGVAALLRKYRLHGLVAGFLLLAALFIWKNSMGFGPEREGEEAESFVAGKDSAAGFVNLLRHHIKPQNLLNTCVTEWKKSQAKGKFSSARIQRVDAFMQTENALPSKERNPVQSYQAICALLKKGPEFQVSNPKSPANTKTL